MKLVGQWSNDPVARTATHGAIVVTDKLAGTHDVLFPGAVTNAPAGQRRVGLKVIKSTGDVHAAELRRLS